MGTNRANCFRCRHFQVTWDARFPRGCRVMGFKGREMPSAVVREASGTECLRFEPRPRRVVPPPQR